MKPISRFLKGLSEVLYLVANQLGSSTEQAIHGPPYQCIFSAPRLDDSTA